MSPKRSGKKNILLAMSRYTYQVHRGLARYAREHDWHVTVNLSFDPSQIREWDGDGILTMIGKEYDIWKLISDKGVPVVDLAATRQDLDLPRVLNDNAKAGQLAAEYFLARGFRNFACINRFGLAADNDRRSNFASTVSDAGHTCHILAWETQTHRRDDYAARQRWIIESLQDLPKPLAVFAMPDHLASEVIEACETAQLRVPEDVAVLGYDNDELICECLSVSLSSIDPDFVRLGYEGAQYLDQLIEGATAHDGPKYIEPIGVISRQSTAIYAVDHTAVSLAMRLIQENATRCDFSIAKLCKQAGMSRSGLEKAFRQQLGRLPAVEIRRLRLEKTKELLEDTNDSLKLVAEQSGFATPKNLLRNFRKAFNTTPKLYRREFREAQQRKLKEL